MTTIEGRITSMEGHISAQIRSERESLEKLFTEKLLRVEQVLDARLTRIEEHLNLR
jgi:hypothetical protein